MVYLVGWVLDMYTNVGEIYIYQSEVDICTWLCMRAVFVEMTGMFFVVVVGVLLDWYGMFVVLMFLELLSVGLFYDGG